MRGPYHRIYFIRSEIEICDEVGAAIAQLDFAVETVLEGQYGGDHAWGGYLAPTVLTVDAVGEEDIIWGGPERETAPLSVDLLEARFYTRSSDFKFLRSRLDADDTGLSGFLWIVVKASDRQVPKVYWTANTRDGLDQGAAITVEPTPRLLFAGTSAEGILKELMRFVARNHQVLLCYWNMEIDTRGCLSQLIYR